MNAGSIRRGGGRCRLKVTPGQSLIPKDEPCFDAFYHLH